MSAGKAGLHAPSHCPCMSVSRHTHVRAADRGHRGSTCVYTKTKPVLKSPVQKTCLHVESGCILGSPFYFRKEIEVKGEKQLVSWCVCVWGGLRAEGGLGVTVPSQVHGQGHALFRGLWTEGFALVAMTTRPRGWFMCSSVCPPHPTQETSSAARPQVSIPS